MNYIFFCNSLFYSTFSLAWMTYFCAMSPYDFTFSSRIVPMYSTAPLYKTMFSSNPTQFHLTICKKKKKLYNMETLKMPLSATLFVILVMNNICLWQVRRRVRMRKIYVLLFAETNFMFWCDKLFESSWVLLKCQN
jgi:hypothetical protein